MYDLLLNQDLEDWVKARSTTGTWYSQFLMTQYNDKKWIEHFQVSKSFVRQLIHKLNHKLAKKNTKFKCALHVDIRVACSLYKLMHTSKHIHCSELFTIRKSTVHFILWDFIHVVNPILNNQIRWAEGYHMLHIMEVSSSF